MTIQPIPRSRKAWHALRLNNITASEIAPLLGMGAAYQTSPFGLFHIKSGTVPAPVIESERMQAGTFLETGIAKWAAHREGWKIRKGVFAIDDNVAVEVGGVTKGASATLDFMIEGSPALEALGYFGPGALEVKNVDRWEFEKKWDNGEPPAHIALQHQQQLGCTGWLWGAVAVCRGGNELEVVYYHRREGIVEGIRNTIVDFWSRVREQRPYPVDHFESTLDTLKAMYKPVEDTHLDLSEANDLPELVAEWEALGTRKKEIEKRQGELTATFRERVKNYRTASGNGFRFSHSVGADTPDRVAEPGEVIKGRKGQDRFTITVVDEAKRAAKGKTKAAANDAAAEQVAA